MSFIKVAHKYKKKLAEELDKSFNDLKGLYGKWTKEQSNMFIAQLAHETGRFLYTHELGGYKYLQYLEGRKDLGNTTKGDGVKYKGRGLIMITGKFNYKKYGDKLGINLIEFPEQAEDPSIAILIALEYWTDRNIKKCNGDVRCATKKVNGGTNGLKDRIKLYNKLMEVNNE